MLLFNQQYNNQLLPMEQEKNSAEHDSAEQSESSYSSEDEDGVLLTNQVEEKLLTVVAKIRNKDPSIYNIDKPVFEEQDFQAKQRPKKKGKEASNSKITYQDLVTKKDKGGSDSDEEEEKPEMDLDQIKQSFKSKLGKNTENGSKDDDLLRIKKRAEPAKKNDKDKLKQFVSGFKDESSMLLTGLWKNDKKLDSTDRFLKNYIINERWKASKMKENELPLAGGKQEMIDEEDEERSVEMDEYEANYNFRFQEPGSEKIALYPREIPESMRLKPETRKEKRKKLGERKKQEEEEIRKQYEEKKTQKKEEILKKLNEYQQAEKMEEESSDFDHDWFFCDDCAKALEEKEQYYVCGECGEYMLCQQCHELIIHKHKMDKAVIPIGAGPPPTEKAEKALQKLKSCKGCRKKIPSYLRYYEYGEKKSPLLGILCDKCYDESTLEVKKKFKVVQPSANQINYEQLLEKDPERIKVLNTQKDIEELVDEYIKYDFEDIIGGGLKTKFKYINVKPEGYGLSDQQILYGDDKELNKYVSIKKLGAYEDEGVRLRNNMYNRKIKQIKKSVQENKKLLSRVGGNTQALRAVKRIQTRAEILRKRRESRNQKLKIVNISNPEDEKKLLLPSSRLASYGLAVDGQGQRQNGV